MRVEKFTEKDIAALRKVGLQVHIDKEVAMATCEVQVIRWPGRKGLMLHVELPDGPTLDFKLSDKQLAQLAKYD
jgi:hypothetical protein